MSDDVRDPTDREIALALGALVSGTASNAAMGRCAPRNDMFLEEQSAVLGYRNGEPVHVCVLVHTLPTTKTYGEDPIWWRAMTRTERTQWAAFTRANALSDDMGPEWKPYNEAAKRIRNRTIDAKASLN
jgi:hypothetical protein